MNKTVNLAILCDFDGTIVNIDTVEYLFKNFIKEDWEIFDSQFEKGEITLEECMQKQFLLIKMQKTLILKELEKVTSFRRNFEELLKYCVKKNIPFIIVSAGLDFYIKYFLEKKGLDEIVKIHSAKTKFTSKGIELSFPKLFQKSSSNFKDDLVEFYKNKAYKVIYMGDGISDYPAVKKADYPFVIKGSKLASLCRGEEYKCQEFDDFQVVIDHIKRFLLS